MTKNDIIKIYIFKFLLSFILFLSSSLSLSLSLSFSLSAFFSTECLIQFDERTLCDSLLSLFPTLLYLPLLHLFFIFLPFFFYLRSKITVSLRSKCLEILIKNIFTKINYFVVFERLLF